MKIQPVKEILSRDAPNNELEIFSSVLEDTIDFGTHLLQWDIERNTARKENAVYQTFFKNILGIGDAISILVKHASIDNTKPLTRILLENIFCLEYLLEKDSKSRALAYLVATFHKEKALSKKLDKSTSAGKEFYAQLRKDKMFKNIPLKDVSFNKNYDKDSAILQLPDFVSINEEYVRTASTKRNPNWYSLYDGPKDMEQLAKHLNHHALYETYYRAYSEHVHASNIIKNNLVKVNSDLLITPLRESQDAKYVTQDTLNFINIAYTVFINKRIPEKGVIFQRWRDDFNLRYDEIESMTDAKS